MRSVEQVDPFIGTDNTFAFGHGNTLPIMARPWGNHHWSPANSTRDGDPWFFQYRENGFHGLRLTHQPSPWMRDWGHATLMPQSGGRRTRLPDRQVVLPSRWLDLRPHRFRCVLPEQGIIWEAAPTRHGLAFRVTWQSDGPRRLILDSAPSGSAGPDFASVVAVRPDSSEMVLQARNMPSSTHPAFSLHLVLRSGLTPIGGGVFGPEGDFDGMLHGQGPARGGWLELPPGSGPVSFWLAASFIDEDSARHLLGQDLVGRSVEEVTDEGAQEWNRLLDRLELAGDEPLAPLARSFQYRTLLFPRRLDEPDPLGKPRHRCPDTGRIVSGIRVTDNGFWDTARTVYPWLALLYPDRLPDLLEGWVAGARATGWFPSWASPGHRVCMTGSYADAVFADALARGIGGWDPAEVLGYLRRHTEEPVPDDAPFGRVALDAYRKLGYVPFERIPKATARTLDYAYGDWCLARIANVVGRQEDRFRDGCRMRAGNWRTVLDPVSGFFRGRHADGSWLEPFDPTEWGGAFVEGSAWQFAWHVPHQPEELIAARGGRTRAKAFLAQLFNTQPAYKVGSYGHAIHEMREMAAVDFGQYAHSNQPSHFTLPYWAHCGEIDTLVHWRDRVCLELHRACPDGYPGDEDNGEMSAWWLCAAIGLFPDCPGRESWLVLPTLFKHCVLHVPNRPRLDLSPGTGGGPDRPVGSWMTHQALVDSEPEQ